MKSAILLSLFKPRKGNPDFGVFLMFKILEIKMSAWLDQIKYNMSNQMSKVYKDAKAKASHEEWTEFESWFWKIKPFLVVDVSKYSPGGNSETSGPNFSVKSDLQKV